MCDFSLDLPPTPAPFPPSLPSFLPCTRRPCTALWDTVVIKTDTFCVLEGPSRELYSFCPPLFFLLLRHPLLTFSSETPISPWNTRCIVPVIPIFSLHNNPAKHVLLLLLRPIIANPYIISDSDLASTA